MLPWDFKRRLLSLLRTTEEAEGADLPSRSDEECRLLAALHRTTPTDERRVVRTAAARTALRRLVRDGLVVREWRWERPRATPQFRATLRLAVPAEEAQRHAAGLPDAYHQQRALLEYLATTPSVDRTAARKEFGSSRRRYAAAARTRRRRPPPTPPRPPGEPHVSPPGRSPTRPTTSRRPSRPSRRLSNARMAGHSSFTASPAAARRRSICRRWPAASPRDGAASTSSPRSP